MNKRLNAGGGLTHRGAFIDGLLGGLGFGVLFVALARIPESAGTLPLALNQLTGSLKTWLMVVSVFARLTRPGDALTTMPSCAWAHTGKSAVEFPA